MIPKAGSLPHRQGPGRREMLKQLLMASTWLMTLPALSGWMAGRGASGAVRAETPSPYGFWQMRGSLPEFVYDADQDTLDFALWDPLDRPLTRRHFHMMGNRAVQAQASNTGDIALFDESEAMRWLVYGDDRLGTGHGRIHDSDGQVWGSDFRQRPPGNLPQRVFGTTYFRVQADHEGLRLERTVLCPEGEAPGLMVRVELSLAQGAAPRRFTYEEDWALRPRFLRTWQADAVRDQVSETVVYSVSKTETGLEAQEHFSEPGGVTGSPARLVLSQLSPAPVHAEFAHAVVPGTSHPALRARADVTLQPDTSLTLWFWFGRPWASPPDAGLAWQENFETLTARLPSASGPAAPALAREIAWHGAVLTGGASLDRKLGGHTLNQASVYGYGLGANAAARDALQHALPLIYTEPDLALSVLRNTCAWASPDGDIPYALNHAKEPITDLLRPSDQNLWALWLASEYAAATGDLAAFGQPQGFHPSHGAGQVTLKDHLVRQFRFLVDTVGRGARGHIRLLNADWNDMVLNTIAADRARMIEAGGSVLNSAMASWVLSVFSGLMTRLGDASVAAEAAGISAELRALVAESWNGRWVDRAYSPGGDIIGRHRCWLEVQPWAILCGAVTGSDALSLLEHIHTHHRSGSPLGARIIHPADPSLATVGQGTKGGVWYSINMTLIWAAAGLMPELAWDEWRRLSLAGHVAAYPQFWEGTLSGPDAWNAPESDRPGRTWTSPRFHQQSFPVNNLHSHSQPILSCLRLLGVMPGADGSLEIRPGRASPPARFSSAVFSLEADGSGWLEAAGPVEIVTRAGRFRGGPGRTAFSQAPL